MCFGGLGVVVTGYFSKSRSSCNESIFDSGMHKAITMFEVSLKAHKQLENNFPERTQQLHTATALWFPLDYRLKWLSRVLAHKFSFSVVVTFCFSTCITLKKSSNSFCCSGGGAIDVRHKLFSKSLKSNCFWLGAIWPPNTFAQKFFLVFPSSSITTSSSNNATK